MVCFNLYIFDRQGTCLHYHEWYRPKSVKQGAGTLVDDQKQMFGLFWTLSNFTAALDAKGCACRSCVGAAALALCHQHRRWLTGNMLCVLCWQDHEAAVGHTPQDWAGLQVPQLHHQHIQDALPGVTLRHQGAQDTVSTCNSSRTTGPRSWGS